MNTLSLELSKELTELCKSKGIVMPESYLRWYNYFANEWKVISEDCHAYGCPGTECAYSLDELLEWLPKTINKTPPGWDENIDWDLALLYDYTKIDKWRATYQSRYCENGWTGLITFGSDNPCNAVGKLLIWASKEGYL